MPRLIDAMSRLSVQSLSVGWGVVTPDGERESRPAPRTLLEHERTGGQNAGAGAGHLVVMSSKIYDRTSGTGRPLSPAP